LQLDPRALATAVEADGVGVDFEGKIVNARTVHAADDCRGKLVRLQPCMVGLIHEKQSLKRLTSRNIDAMNKITPRDFRNAFVGVMQSEHDSFRTAVGFETKSYNFFMRTTIYPRVARHLGLLSWNKEYYTLDGMLYEERGVDNTGKYATFANWISVAIEHENDSSRAYEKMNKLQSFNAPLKVSITYAAEDASDALLQKYENLIRSSDVFNDVATLRQQLVILGTPKTVREWRFYAYENGGFVLMLPN
jgi:hypothetical protein